jgi:hypothetical protein
MGAESNAQLQGNEEETAENWGFSTQLQGNEEETVENWGFS